VPAEFDIIEVLGIAHAEDALKDCTRRGDIGAMASLSAKQSAPCVQLTQQRLGGLCGSRLGWRWPAKRHTTFIAEFRNGSIGCPASETMPRQGCAAGIAEFGDLRILTIAAWTPHDLRRSSLLQFGPAAPLHGSAFRV
jgi:hypothetical protein